MSLYINFEPHSWYKGFAIKHNTEKDSSGFYIDEGAKWQAYTDDGNTYRVVTIESDKSLVDLKSKIRDYWAKEEIRIKKVYDSLL